MKTNPFYSLRKYASKIGAQREFEWMTMDWNPLYRDIGVNELIARDTYQSLKVEGRDFDDLKRELREVSANHPTYKGWNHFGSSFDEKEVTYWAIKLGLLRPLKREKTYQGAFSALCLPFRPMLTRRF